MSKLKIKFFALACVFVAAFITGCAASGPKFTELEKPSNDKALVYIYRPFSGVAQGGGPEMLIDGKTFGTLLNSGYTATYLTPGKHKVTAKGNIWNWAFPDLNFEINVAPGDTTYVRLIPDLAQAPQSYNSVTVGFSQNFSVVEAGIARSEIVTCRRIK